MMSAGQPLADASEAHNVCSSAKSSLARGHAGGMPDQPLAVMPAVGDSDRDRTTTGSAGKVREQRGVTGSTPVLL